MPILEIEVVLKPGETLPDDLAAQLADRAGMIFQTATAGTWVKLRALPGEQYAENGVASTSMAYPVFVSVLKAATSAEDALQNECAQLAAMIGVACSRCPENVHIVYLPAAAGRIAFGGKLRTSS